MRGLIRELRSLINMVIVPYHALK